MGKPEIQGGGAWKFKGAEGKMEQGDGRKVEYPGMKTTDQELEKLPVMTVAAAIDLFAKRKEQGQDRGSVLIETAALIELLEALFDFKVTAKTLKTYASPRVKLLPAAVKKDGKSCYVYPDQLDRIGFILALRQAYHLPLNTIRDLDKAHFPGRRPALGPGTQDEHRGACSTWPR